MFKDKKIGVGICGSFCTHTKLIETLKELYKAHADLYLIITPEVLNTDTRFFKAKDFLELIQKYTKHPLVTSIAQAELFGPKTPLDLMLIMPASANTMGKIAHGICDNPVIMATKATLRNEKPVVVSFYTNDALGNSGENIMRLINTKGFYFVPFGQDDIKNKPKSMVSDHHLIPQTMKEAFAGRQIQPLVVCYHEN